MRLTTFTDYALRVLLFAGAADGRLVNIEETAAHFKISKSHLMKVVNALTRAGFLEGVRGRSGGFRLGKAPEDINLGQVVRTTEPDFALVECFAANGKCAITAPCRLPNIINEALNSFVFTLEQYTLADIMLTERDFLSDFPTENNIRGPKLRDNDTTDRSTDPNRADRG